MAHGFAGERLARLPAFAEHFCDAGYAVFLFDYRYFGDSEGEPRQLVSPWRQIEDWRAAIAHVRTLDSIDQQRIILWGTSFSGGHVISVASEDHDIRAVIAQIPFTSGLSLVAQNSVPDALHMTWAGIKDVSRAITGSEPHHYPVVAHPGEHAIMNKDDSYEGYTRLFDADSRWVNRVPARINLQIPFYNPIFIAQKVQCPTLILAGRNDNLIPPTTVKSMADRIPQGEYHEMNTGHFEPYVDSSFEENIAVQIQFLQKHIPVESQ